MDSNCSSIDNDGGGFLLWLELFHSASFGEFLNGQSWIWRSSNNRYFYVKGLRDGNGDRDLVQITHKLEGHRLEKLNIDSDMDGLIRY